MEDSILFWNAVALEANRVSHTDPARREQNGPTLSSRAIAIVHLAMYDAYAAIVGGVDFPRYLASPPLPHPPPAPPPPPAHTEPRNAVAGAAHRTLSVLYPAQREFFDAQLSCFQTKDSYFCFGEQVGQALLDFRENDPDARDCGYMVSPRRGRHRVDPDNPDQGFDSPFYGAQSRGFAITDRHPLDPPPFDDGEDEEYLESLRQARREGILPELLATLPDALFARRRMTDRALKGIYWAYDGASRIGTPPRLYNQIIRVVAMNTINPATGQVNGEGENARLFAFVNAALGDAGILAWEQKYCHDFWRPVVGIREHDRSFGPAACNLVDTECETDDAGNKLDPDADPWWLPLGAPSTNTTMKNFTPNFPAYPSGHATFGAAAFHVARLFYGVPLEDRNGDDLFTGLAFVSDELNGRSRDNRGTVRPRHVRSFEGGLWDMIIENARSRIYLGVHWIFDAFIPVELDEAEAKRLGDKIPPDFDRNVGGVILGVNIAEDIFRTGAGIAPVITPDEVAEPPIVTPPPCSPMPTKPTQPASVGGCADDRCKPRAEDPEPERVKSVYPRGLSPR